MKKILSISLVLLVGALIGGASGFNPLISAGAMLMASMFIYAPSGVAMVGLDLSEVTTQLGDYFRYYSKEVWAQITKGSDFEQYMRAVPNVKSRYISTTSSRTEFLQAFQKGFQAKGSVALTPYENIIYPIKMDHTQDNLHALHETYLAFLNDESKLPSEIPFVKWLVDMHIIPGMTEELRRMSVIGQYVAPTTDVAGDSIASANGVFTIIDNEVTAGNLVPILTGEITPENVVDKVELFHKSLPSEYRTLPGVIFAASDLVEDYKYGYREAFGTNQDFNGPTVNLWGTRKQLVGLDDLNGSGRLLFTPTGATGNLLKMYDKIQMPAPQVQLDKRDVHILADFHRGWGFQTLESVFVNDQSFPVEEEPIGE